MSVGNNLYLRVEGLEPSWRQALVLTSKKGGSKLQLAVRVTDKELEADEKWKSLSYFELQSEKFILVAGEISRTRKTCVQPHRALEVSAKELMSKGLAMLGEDDLQFATASEDIDDKAAGRKKVVELESSGSGESSSEESDGDALLKLLEKAKSSRTDMAMPSGKKDKARAGRRKSGRYPFLEEETSSRSAGEPELMELMKKMASSSSTDMGQQLNTLVQMEILKTLRTKKKSSGKDKTSTSEDDTGPSDSHSSSEETGKLRGAGRAMQAYRRGKKSMQKRPLRHIRRYVKEVELQMGVTDGSAYKLSDYSKKLAWGKHRSLMRIHYAVSEALEQLLKGKTKLAGLQLVQLLRGVHQCSLDGGDWRTAWLLLHLPDPVERPRFGGEVQELEIVASYVKAMNELERKSRVLAAGGERGEEEVEGGKGKKGKGKKKQQQQSEENMTA